MADTASTPVDPGLSHAVGRTDVPLLEQTIGENLDLNARKNTEREALVETDSGRRWTYAELLTEVERTARAFLASGVRRGDRVGLWAPNCAEWAIVQLATAKMGAILVTVDPASRTHELAIVLRRSGVSTIVVAEAFRGSSYPDMVEEVRRECPELVQVLVVGSPGWKEFLGGAPQVTRDRLAELQAQVTPQDPVTIRYTSGTTGAPRGATFSHRSILNTGFFVGEGCGHTEQDVIGLPSPFDHGLGMVVDNLAAVTHGACMVIPGPGLGPDTAATPRTDQGAELSVEDLTGVRTGAVGGVLPHLEIRIVDPASRETVPRGQPGEVCTKGYSVMLGYWEEPEKTAEVLRDGWLATGDLGVMDEQGHVQITGRATDPVPDRER